MSDIAPLNGLSPASLSTAAQTTRRPAEVGPQVNRGSDQIQLSGTARILAKLNTPPEVRQDLVDRVRGEIAQGTYETPDKIDAAVEGLADELAQN